MRRVPALAAIVASALACSDSPPPAAPAPPPAPVVLRPCVYVVAGGQDSFQIPLNGGSFADFRLNLSSGRCSWQAASNDPWITVVTPSGDDGDTLRYNVEPLTIPLPPAPFPSLPRKGTILVSWLDGQMALAVSQVGCRFMALPASVSVPAAGFVGRYGVLDIGNCPWSSSSDVGWLRSGHTGVTELGVFADPNSSMASRSGTVSVSWSGGGSKMVVVQSGAQ
jgi:hypothetical protein